MAVPLCRRLLPPSLESFSLLVVLLSPALLLRSLAALEAFRPSQRLVLQLDSLVDEDVVELASADLASLCTALAGPGLDELVLSASSGELALSRKEWSRRIC